MANTIYVNVDGTWKTASNYYVNVDGTWKTGTEFQINVSSAWKGGAAAVAMGLPTTEDILSLDYLEWSLPSIGTVDAKAGIDSVSLDYLEWSLPSAGRTYTGIVFDTNLKLHLDASITGSYGGSGTTWADLTSEDNDATISGATYSSSDGGKFVFDGMGGSIYTGDHAITAHSSDFEFGSGDFTVEAWCKPTNTSQIDPSVVSLWNFPDGKRSWGIFGNTGGSASAFNGSIRATVSPDGQFATRTEITGSLTLDAWNHVVFTRISNTLTFYINASSEGTASYTGSVYSNTSDGVLIGAMGDAAESRNHFAGDIAQVRVYKGTGLTSTQVTQNYNSDKSTFGL